MPQITVLVPFLLNLGGTLKRFEAGFVEVADEIADHWYVKLFSAPKSTEVVVAPAEQAAPIVATTPEPAPAEAQADDVDEKAALKAEAEALGIDVDGRWGVGRLKTEIEAKKKSA